METDAIMDNKYSIEHQMRYEMARANIYRDACRELVSAMRCTAGDIEGVIRSKMRVLNNDWIKAAEAGLVRLNDADDVAEEMARMNAEHGES